MSASVDRDEPEREHGLGPALRDVLAGVALLGLGLWTGGSTLDGDFDRLDVFFDALAALWILWGVARLALARRSGDAA